MKSKILLSFVAVIFINPFFIGKFAFAEKSQKVKTDTIFARSKTKFKKVFPAWQVSQQMVESVSQTTDSIKLVGKDKAALATLKLGDLPRIEGKFGKTDMPNKKIVAAALSPQHDKVFFGAANNDGIWVGYIDLTSGTIQQISPLSYTGFITTRSGSFLWSPDGKKVAIPGYLGEAGASVYIFDVNTGNFFPSLDVALKYSKKLIDRGADLDITDLNWVNNEQVKIEMETPEWTRKPKKLKKEFILNIQNGILSEL